MLESTVAERLEEHTSYANSRLTLFSGGAHPQLAEAIGKLLHVPLAASTISKFPDGESRVAIHEDVRDNDVFIVQPLSAPVNDNAFALALLIDAARGMGARKIYAVVPYLGYSRQERRKDAGEPRSAQVLGKFLAAAGLDHLITLDLHESALESAFMMEVTALRSQDLFLPVIRDWGVKDLIIVSPDAGGLKRAQRYAAAMNVKLAAVAKEREGPEHVTHIQVLGDVRGKRCVVIDDIVSTGHTLLTADAALRAAGAAEVKVIFTHAILGEEALLRLLYLDELVTSDSVPFSVPATTLKVVSSAPLFANAIRALTKSYY